MANNDRHDDVTDVYLRDRGWFSRRQHGEENGYRPHFDAWGLRGSYPGGISITCLGGERYEVAWVSAKTGVPVVEHLTGSQLVRDRAVELEEHTDYVPN